MVFNLLLISFFPGEMTIFVHLLFALEIKMSLSLNTHKTLYWRINEITCTKGNGTNKEETYEHITEAAM